MNAVDIIEQFRNRPIKEEIKKAISCIQKIQDAGNSLAHKNEEHSLTAIKIGTTLTLAVVSKVTNGKRPEEFTEDDWKDIANAVNSIAIIQDGKYYSMFVFRAYADFIDAEAKIIRGKISDKVYRQITDLTAEILQLTNALEKGSLTEPDYVEQCLWISTEDAFKLLSAFLGAFKGPELSELNAAVTTLSVQYARLKLYQKEEAIVDKFLQNQERLDAELQKEVDAYTQESEELSQHFDHLIEDAFNPDFGTQLQSSANLAREMGVQEDEILKTEEDIDAFFMD